MCNCNKHTQIGNYGNQVMVLAWWSNSFICIDRCLFDEITLLWADEIITTGCCCGHNQIEGFIGVEIEHIQEMKDLGYTVQFNPMRPNSETSFNLKTNQ